MLINSDASALPFVKSALLGIVGEGNWQQLRGLDYVIGAFLVLGMKYAPGDVVPFTNGLPREFNRRIIRVIPAFFQQTVKKGQYNFSVAPTEELIAFVRRLTSDPDEQMRKTANRTLAWLEGRKPS